MRDTVRLLAATTIGVAVLACTGRTAGQSYAQVMSSSAQPRLQKAGIVPSRRALDLQPASWSRGRSHTRALSPIEMSATVGWNGYARGHPDWAPVRITIRNTGPNLIHGTVRIPDTAEFDAGRAPLAYQSLYEEPVVLPAATTKQVTCYLPGGDVGGRVIVSFAAGKRILASTSSFPVLLGDSDISIGALTSDPTNLSWVSRVRMRGARIRVLTLRPSTLDPVAEALANFDVIVISDVDTSGLTAAQDTALDRYVRNGGTVLVVGGPDAGETISGLPRSLVPGRLIGVKTVAQLPEPNLALAGILSREPTTVSVMRAEHGSVWAEEDGIPMVVRAPLGNGLVEFTAFDPAVVSFTSSSASSSALSWLVTGAALQAVRRLSLPPDYRGVTYLDPGVGFFPLLGGLSGSPAAPLTLILLVTLIAAYVVAVGPLSLRVRSHLRRPELRWIGVPALAAILIGLTNVLAPRLQLTSVSLNEIGLISMDGAGPLYPARLYVGLNPGGPGTFRVSYPQAALALPIGPYAPNGPPQRPSVGWAFQESTPASFAADSVPARTTRLVALRTVVSIRGSIESHLELTSSGELVGTISNRTNLDLQAPALIAGQAFQRLGHMSPGQTVRVRVKPSSNIHDRAYSPMLPAVYGSAVAPSKPLLSGRSDQLNNIRGTIAILPETNLLSEWESLSLVAWTSRPAALFTIPDAAPARRGLDLIVRPLSFRLPAGPLTINPGTLSAHLVDGSPTVPRYPCCGPSAQSMFIGSGGSDTFEFDIPRDTRVSARSLSLWVYGGSPDPSYSGYTDVPKNEAHVFDWVAHRWIAVTFLKMRSRLPHPSRFVSASGALLLRLSVPPHSTELAITDLQHDVQLSGSLVVKARSP